MNNNQIYVPYWLWEEYKFGMWRYVYGEERDILFNKALEFTGNHILYGEYMLRVVKEWIYSCALNLSHPTMNKQAWIGHAACCIALNCPEDITRQAWHYLSQEQQDLANLQADNAIKEWESKYKKGIQPCLNLV